MSALAKNCNRILYLGPSSYRNQHLGKTNNTCSTMAQQWYIGLMVPVLKDHHVNDWRL